MAESGARSGALTLGDLCPQARQDINEFVRGTSKEEAGELPRGILWRMVSGRVSKTVDRVLDTPVEDVLQRGWARLKKLREYKKLPPGEPFREIVGEHTIRSLHEPSLEIEIDDHHIGSLHFSIEIVIHLLGVGLIGKDGHIERAVPRGCSLSGNFACQVTIYNVRQTFPYNIEPIEVPFRTEGVAFKRPIPIP